MKLFKKILLLLFLICWSLAISHQLFADINLRDISPRYVAIITGNNVNIRSGPHESHEIIGQAGFGKTLYVINEKENWIEVELPQDSTSVWVYANLIEKKDEATGIVKKNGVNVRVKPNVKHSIVCQLYKDEEVEIIDKKWDWYQIKAPKNTTGWVSGQFIKKHQTIDEYEDYLREQRISQLFKDAESIYSGELSKGTNIDYDYLLAIYKNIIDNYPKHQKGLIARERYYLLLEKKASHEMAELEVAWQELQDRNGNLLSFVPKYEKIVKDYPETQVAILAKERLKNLQKQDKILPLNKGINKGNKNNNKKVQMIGVINELGVLLNRPATHKLVKNGNIICLLKSNNINLNDFIYSKVTINGMLSNIKGWDIPILEVKEIKKLKWKGRM